MRITVYLALKIGEMGKDVTKMLSRSGKRKKKEKKSCTLSSVVWRSMLVAAMGKLGVSQLAQGHQGRSHRSPHCRPTCEANMSKGNSSNKEGRSTRRQ